jgi:hypothetical protein
MRWRVIHSRRRGIKPRNAAILLASFMFVTVVSTGAPASGKAPIEGCPTASWELRPTPSGDLSGTPSFDVNGDGMSCFLEAPEGSGIFTIIDNVVRNR